MLFEDGQILSGVWNARKKQLDTSLATVSVITWAACEETAGLELQDVDDVYLEDFVHTSTQIK